MTRLGDDDPVDPTDRHGATVVRVALRQHVHLHDRPPRNWLEAFDLPLLRVWMRAGE